MRKTTGSQLASRRQLKAGAPAFAEHVGGLGARGLTAFGVLLILAAGVAAQSHPPRVVITPRVIQLPVIPQGNYLDPGPGPAIRPDVKIGSDRNTDYAFPPDLTGGWGSGPPGDPTNNGQWSPLDGATPSF